MITPSASQPSLDTLRAYGAAVSRQSRLAAACFIFVSAAVVAAVLLAPKVYDANLKLLVKRDRADSLVSGTPEVERADTGDLSEAELLSEVELLQARELLRQVVVTTGLATPAARGSASGNREAAIADAVTRVHRDLNVAAIRKTWMIDVTYTAASARQAKDVLDTLMRLYLEKHLAVQRPLGAHQFFVEQADRSAADLRAAQARLREFGERHHVVSSSQEQARSVQKGAEFEQLQRQTEVDLAETTRRIAALSTEKARTPAQQTAEIHRADPGLVQELQSRIVSLEVKRTELTQKYTPQYRLVTEVDELLAQTRGALDDARRGQVTDETVASNPTMQWLDNEIARARPERAALEVRARTSRDTAAAYRAEAQRLTVEDMEQQELQRDVKSAEAQYLLYQRKQEEARISDALDRTRIANVVVVDSPTLPSEARRTLSLMWLPIGLAFALMLAVGGALVKDRLSGVDPASDAPAPAPEPGPEPPPAWEPKAEPAARPAPIIDWAPRHVRPPSPSGEIDGPDATTGSSPTDNYVGQAWTGDRPGEHVRPIPAARLVATIDVVAVLATFFAVIAGVNIGRMPNRIDEFLALRVTLKNVVVLGSLIIGVLVVFRSAGLYDAARLRRWGDEVRRLFVAVSIMTAFAMIVPATSHSGTVSYWSLAPFWAGSFGALWLARSARARLASGSRERLRVLIVGTGPHALRIYRDVSSDVLASYTVVGFVDTTTAPASQFIARRTLGQIEQLEELLVREHVDEVHVGLPVASHYQQIQDTIRVCERLGVKAIYNADIFTTGIARARMPTEPDHPARVHLHMAPDGARLVVKRVLDVCSAAIAIVLLSPVMALAAIAIKLTSDGPVIYSQKRFGLNRRTFEMYKFRTMVQDADALQASLEARNEAAGPVFKIANDPRITRVGKFLRRSSIDELPQLFNVLRGDMSLVGPRPLPLRDVARFTRTGDLRRLSVRPGVTGPWQISGRSDLAFDDWVKLDLDYIDRWSLGLDLLILARTLPAVMRGAGAR